MVIRRRDKVVAYWITRTNPLDSFAVTRTSAGASLGFDNAAIRLQVAPAKASYTGQWFVLDNVTGTERVASADIQVADPRMDVPETAWGPAEPSGFRYAVVRIKTIHPGYPVWTEPVVVTIRERGGQAEVVGIERPTGRSGEAFEDGSGER